jgi:hypothetical protein
MTPLPPGIGPSLVWERDLKMVTLRITRFWRRRGTTLPLVHLCFVKILDKPWMMLGRSAS